VKNRTIKLPLPLIFIDSESDQNNKEISELNSISSSLPLSQLFGIGYLGPKPPLDSISCTIRYSWSHYILIYLIFQPHWNFLIVQDTRRFSPFDPPTYSLCFISSSKPLFYFTKDPPKVQIKFDIQH